MSVTEVMHDPERRPIPDREEQAPLSRGGACLVCGEWVDWGATDALRVQVRIHRASRNTRAMRRASNA